MMICQERRSTDLKHAEFQQDLSQIDGRNPDKNGKNAGNTGRTSVVLK
jgi:hypothetical protein